MQEQMKPILAQLQRTAVDVRERQVGCMEMLTCANYLSRDLDSPPNFVMLNLTRKACQVEEVLAAFP